LETMGGKPPSPDQPRISMGGYLDTETTGC
jgi:hypothetical protein